MSLGPPFYWLFPQWNEFSHWGATGLAGTEGSCDEASAMRMAGGWGGHVKQRQTGPPGIRPRRPPCRQPVRVKLTTAYLWAVLEPVYRGAWQGARRWPLGVGKGTVRGSGPLGWTTLDKCRLMMEAPSVFELHYSKWWFCSASRRVGAENNTVMTVIQSFCVHWIQTAVLLQTWGSKNKKGTIVF